MMRIDNNHCNGIIRIIKAIQLTTFGAAMASSADVFGAYFSFHDIDCVSTFIVG
jgi:hypothetical protein